MSTWSGVAEAYRYSFGTLCEGTLDRLLLDTYGGKHLDVGCGSGTLAAQAARMAREVVALDADPEMVAVSQMVVPGRVLRGALPELPFGGDQFDVVTANFVINHVPDPRAAVRELARVARPGGQVAVTIWPAERNAWGALVADAFERAGVTSSPAPRLSPELDFERSVDGLCGLAEASGVQVVKATRLEWVWTVGVDALWRGIAAGIASVGQQFLAQTAEVQRAAESEFRAVVERHAKSGILRLPSAAAYVVATPYAARARSSL